MLVLKYATEHNYSPHNLSNNQANFKVNGTDFTRKSIFKIAVFACSSYSRNIQT